MKTIPITKFEEFKDKNKNNSEKEYSRETITQLFELPFNDLLFKAQSIHRANFDANEVQLSSLLNIKKGACPEDCSYCPQSIRHKTKLKPEKLMSMEDVLDNARKAKDAGATRFCMGAAYRAPKDRDIEKIIPLLQGVKNLGLETCLTLGMLSKGQVSKLSDAGLDYYNHNVDTSKEYYDKIITTRTYDDRLRTISKVQEAGIKVCSGGIVGLGESKEDRIGMLMTLANLKPQPQSVPINMLVRVKGTPLENNASLDSFDFVRTIAVARILMPKSAVRLSAGRTEMSEELQSLCFHAGANSIFYGEELLTTENPSVEKDAKLFNKLGITPSRI